MCSWGMCMWWWDGSLGMLKNGHTEAVFYLLFNTSGHVICVVTLPCHLSCLLRQGENSPRYYIQSCPIRISLQLSHHRSAWTSVCTFTHVTKSQRWVWTVWQRSTRRCNTTYLSYIQYIHINSMLLLNTRMCLLSGIVSYGYLPPLTPPEY